MAAEIKIKPAFSPAMAVFTASTYAFPLFTLSGSTLHTYKTGLSVSKFKSLINNLFSGSISSVLAFCPFNKWAWNASHTSNIFEASLSPVLACLKTFEIFFSSDSRSFNCNSVSIISLSRTGFTEPST